MWTCWACGQMAQEAREVMPLASDTLVIIPEIKQGIEDVKQAVEDLRLGQLTVTNRTEDGVSTLADSMREQLNKERKEHKEKLAWEVAPVSKFKGELKDAMT